MRNLGIATLIFIFVYVVYILSPVSLQGDSRWTIQTALRLIHHGDADLREYAPAVVASHFYAIECVFPDKSRKFPVASLDQCAGAALYHFHPIAVPVLAAPLVASLEGAVKLARPLFQRLAGRLAHPALPALARGELADCTQLVENLVSAVFAAGAAVALYFVAAAVLPAVWAVAFTFTFSFATLMWSVVSRALWQHSPSILLNSLLLVLLLRIDRGRRLLVAAGFLLALAFFVRPTNAVPAAVFGVYLLWRFGKGAVWAVAGGLPPLVFFAWLNLHMYGAVLAPFSRPVRQGSSGLMVHRAIPEALLANLVSPARGLFVFMPFFLLLLVPRLWRLPMPDRFRELRPWFCAVVLLHMILVTTHTDWWGGFSFGPRYLTDILPYLMILWLPTMLAARTDRRVAAAAAVLVVVAGFIQFRGATSIQVHHWNATPVSVNEQNSRIWDWTDPPFLRGLH
jgi:hypothetical protein